MPPTKKPSPISRKLSKKPAAKKVEKAPAPAQAPAAFNDISPITAKQIARAERAIDNLRDEVKTLHARKPKIQVEAPTPEVVVNIPARPRITRVTVKYDNFGAPSEFIPQYSEI